MVRNRVPCIVNAHKQQQQGRGSNRKQRRAYVRTSCEGCNSQRGVRRERQQNMKQPIFEHRLVCALPEHPADYNCRVRYPAEAEHAPQNCSRMDLLPRRTQNSSLQQYGAKVDNGRRRKCMSRLRSAGSNGPAGNERQDDELQSNQGARRRSDNYVEILPHG